MEISKADYDAFLAAQSAKFVEALKDRESAASRRYLEVVGGSGVGAIDSVRQRAAQECPVDQDPFPDFDEGEVDDVVGVLRTVLDTFEAKHLANYRYIFVSMPEPCMSVIADLKNLSGKVKMLGFAVCITQNPPVKAGKFGFSYRLLEMATTKHEPSFCIACDDGAYKNWNAYATIGSRMVIDFETKTVFIKCCCIGV